MPHNRLNNLLRKARRLVLRTIKQDVILFESIPPYSDNAWPVYRYICENGMLKQYKLMWILQSTDTPREDIPSFVRQNTRLGRLKYKMLSLHTKASVFCNYAHYKDRGDQLTVNLGHGSCIKSVRGVYSMPDNLDYSLIQAPVFADATRYEHSMSDNTILAPLGYPRNDDFFGDAPLDRAALFSVPFRKLIVWYPTFRQHKNGKVAVSDITLPLIHDAEAAARINACAKENGVLVVLKPHFAQDTSYIRKADLSNLVFIDDSFFPKHGIRPYQFLHMSDGLITDYSSVYYDYLLQDKPVALTWEDYEQYKEANGFAVDTDVFCAGGEKVYTAEELCGFIRRVANDEDVLRQQRIAVRDLTNAYADGNSAQRVAQWVQAAVEAYPKRIHQA